MTAELGGAAWNLSEKLAKLWGGLCLTVPGITWIYNGDELGMFGTKRDNPAGDGTGHEDRWYRQPMKWSKERGDSGFNCYYPMGFNNYMMTWDVLNEQLDGVAEQSADANSIYSLYKALISVRRENPVLARGKLTSHTVEGPIICYSVADADSEVLVFVNATNEAAAAEYALPAGAQLLYGSGLSAGAVPAMSVQIYKVK